MNKAYKLLPELFLRAPYYSFAGYDLDRLPEVLAQQAFRNAIFLASPEFYRLLEKKEFAFDLLSDKEKHTLYKYYNRMCFRPTPFGSFASITLCLWGGDGTLQLAGDEKSLLHLLPDQQRLMQPNTGSEADLLIKNPVLYRLGREFRFVKSITDEKGRYRFTLDSIGAEIFYCSLLSLFKKGGLTREELTQWIMQRLQCAPAEAASYVDFLLEEQVLLTPSKGTIIAQRELYPAGERLFWEQWGTSPLDQSPALASLADQVSAPGFSGQVFYAALERKNVKGGPDGDDQDELSTALGVLQRLAIASKQTALQQFALEFRERFDQEKVPLLRALDPDAGIIYGGLVTAAGAGIIEDIGFGHPEEEPSRMDWTDAHRLLMRLWTTALLRGSHAPLRIGPEDLTGLGSPEMKFPQTLALMFRKTEDHLVIDYAGGAAATSLIGRFSMFNEGIAALCRKLAGLEETANPGVAFADIGQLSDLHVDNINRRKQIYRYELPLNTYSTLPAAAQIIPGDLLVSVSGDEVLLESARLGRRVVPRLATAYNFRHNELAVFRFLCDLQYQGLKGGLTFDLENYFPGLDFYPRVTYGPTILSLAKWKLAEKDLASVLAIPAGNGLSQVRAFREQYGLPQKVSIGSYDQQLVFDLGSKQEVSFFLQCVKGLKQVTLLEFLAPCRAVKTGSKPLAGQYVAFFAHDQMIYPPVSKTRYPVKSRVKREFHLGSEWLYLKFYCTSQTANSILQTVIAPVIRNFSGRIKSWFFIRYVDKGHHLRLRIKCAAKDLGTLMNAISEQVDKSGRRLLIKSLQGDTYRRELERYDVRLIPLVEDVFCAGSKLLIDFATGTQEAELAEFSLAILSAYSMISCFLDSHERIAGFCGGIAGHLIAEFSLNRQLKTSLDKKYRALSAAVSDILSGEKEMGGLSRDFTGLLSELILQTEKVAAATSDRPLVAQPLIADLVHMQLNRTFRSDQRQQELLVYYCLEKYLRSQIARSREAL